MNASSVLGRREDVAAILKALEIKEGDKPEQPEQVFSPRKIVEVGVDNGAIRTQEEWVEYFNSKNEVMMNMLDLYNAGKSKDKKLLAALQQDFKDTWEVTSTRIFYQPDSLNARVVHYFGSNVIEPVELEVVIPDYSKGKLVKKGLDDPLGLAFFQAIFGTEDDKEVILETLVKLSGKKRNIRIWTPSQESRKEVPERRLLCGNNYLNYGNFLVDCDYVNFSDNGCSSRVRR